MTKSSTLKNRTSRARPERANHTTASVQDYLAAIYDLASSDRPVIGARLAKHMGVSAPAVTESIQRMTRGGYVKVGRGKELFLTTKGRQIAEVMARRHRLLRDAVSAPHERGRQPPAGVALPARGRIDVDELARETKLCYRIHDSSPVRVSVRSSRYFTMTGVASTCRIAVAYRAHRNSGMRNQVMPGGRRR